jgi:hypothetical protein
MQGSCSCSQDGHAVNLDRQAALIATALMSLAALARASHALIAGGAVALLGVVFLANHVTPSTMPKTHLQAAAQTVSRAKVAETARSGQSRMLSPSTIA